MGESPSDAPTEHTSHHHSPSILLLHSLMTFGGIVPLSPVYDTNRQLPAQPPPAAPPQPTDLDDGDNNNGDNAEDDAAAAAEAEAGAEAEADHDGQAQVAVAAQVAAVQQVQEAEMPGHMSNSSYAMYTSLIPRYHACSSLWDPFVDPLTSRADAETERADFHFLDRWEDEVWTGGYHRTGGGAGVVIGREGVWIVVDEGGGIAAPQPEGVVGRLGGRGYPPIGEMADGGSDAKAEADPDAIVPNSKEGRDCGADDVALPPVPLLSSSSPLDRYGPSRLPWSPARLADVLLHVVRHAVSDLQRNHHLGRAALLMPAKAGCFEDNSGGADGSGVNEDRKDNRKGEVEGNNDGGGIECLRRLLLVLSAEYVRGCNWNFYVRFLDQLTDADLLESDLDNKDDARLRVGRPNHHCHDWKAFVHTLSMVIMHGISRITSSHATVLVAYALMEFDGVSDAAAAMDETWFEGDGGGMAGVLVDSANRGGRERNCQKTMLKQNIFYFNKTSGYGQPNVRQDGIGGAVMANDGDAAVAGAQQEDWEPFRIGMVNAVVTRLGWHAIPGICQVQEDSPTVTPLTAD